MVDDAREAGQKVQSTGPFLILVRRILTAVVLACLSLQAPLAQPAAREGTACADLTMWGWSATPRADGTPILDQRALTLVTRAVVAT